MTRIKIAYDLHIHSCLSLCAEDDCTPGSIAKMAYLAGLNAFALSDHQSARNCPAAERAARELGLIFVPALELETREEVHVLCLFSRTQDALAFSDYVGERLIALPKKRTWRHWVMDEFDNILCEDERYLGSSCDIGIYDAFDLVAGYGGFAIPAHIDRPSHSLLSNLGFFDETMGFTVFEASGGCDMDALIADHPELRGKAFIQNSDAHELISIPDARNYLDIEERSAAGVIDAIKKLAK